MNKSEKNKIAKVFRVAADNTMRQGLTKGTFGHPGSSNCILGHVSFVESKCTVPDSYSGTDTAVGYLCCEARTIGAVPAVSLNDELETNKEDIASLLLSEAIYLENE